jgi:hypothetical protein
MVIIYSFLIKINIRKYNYLFFISPATFLLQYLNEKISGLNTLLLLIIILICLVYSLLTNNEQ